MFKLMEKILEKFPNIRIIVSAVTARQSHDGDVKLTNELLKARLKDYKDTFIVHQGNLRDSE